MPETRDERLALAASAIIVACDFSGNMHLSKRERATLKEGRDKAIAMLHATKISPTDLKALGLRICSEVTRGESPRDSGR